MKTPLLVIADAANRQLLLIGALLLPLTSYAADVATPVAPGIAAHSSLNMLWGVLFLLALVVAAWWLIRRSGGLPLHGGRGMKMVASLSVGARERVVLIEIAGEQWLLGVAPGNVNLLHRFEQPILQGSDGDDFASRMRAVLQQSVRK